MFQSEQGSCLSKESVRADSIFINTKIQRLDLTRKMSTLHSIIPNDGINLVDESTCAFCRSHDKALKTCPRCQCVQYCSRPCQKDDLVHKKFCKILAEAPPVDLCPSSPFNQTRAAWFCEPKTKIADAYFYLGHYANLMYPYLCSFNYYQGLLDCYGDDEYIIDKCISNLIAVGWDDNAFSIMRMWCLPPPDKINDLVSKTDRFKDFFDIVPETQPIPYRFTIGLCLVKLHILNMYESYFEELQVFAEQAANYPQFKSQIILDFVVSEVWKHLVGGEKNVKMLKDQEKHLNRYLKLVDIKSRIFFPAIFNSEPLKLHLDFKDAAVKLEQIDPDLPDLWLHYKDCLVLFQRIMPIVERFIRPKIPDESFALYNVFLQKLKDIGF